MQLLAVFMLLAAAVLPSVLAGVDMFCDCRVQHHKHWAISLHCSRGKATTEDSGFSCQNAEVPDIPRGYQYVPGYALVRLYRFPKTRETAKNFCKGEGARLAVPPNQNAYDGLKQMYPIGRVIPYIFIGISNQVRGSVFVGMDGRPAPYLPWQPREPNKGNGTGEEYCVGIRNDGLIMDVSCGFVAPFFCERRLSVGVPDTYTWVEGAGRFYKIHTEKRVYAEAAKVCRSENATLAVPDTWRRGEVLLRLLESKFNGYYIGFTDEAVEGDFVTEKGRHLKDMELQLWGSYEPSNSDGGKPENCVVFMSSGYYNDVRCDLGLPFICEIVPI